MVSPAMKLLKHLIPLTLAVAGMGLGGCASPAVSTAMVATPRASVKSHAGTVSINVTGGSETSKAGASQISDRDFAAALEQSIRESALFAGIASSAEPGTYHLEVAIVRVQQPMFGLNMTVTVETAWTLSRAADKSVLWRRAITTSHTAKAGEAFAGVKRLRLANEGAARENIREAITQMSALSLE
jgi:hypothetical protein